MELKDRLKQVRKFRGMNQKEFSSALGIAQSTLGMMEVGKREILDRHIKTICSVFNVSEQWLRYGTGNMFTDNNDILQNLASEYRLDMFDMKFIESFVKLKADQRRSIIAFFMEFTKTVNAECLPEEIADYGRRRIYRAAHTKEKSNDFSDSGIIGITDERLEALQSAKESNEDF